MVVWSDPLRIFRIFGFSDRGLEVLFGFICFLDRDQVGSSQILCCTRDPFLTQNLIGF